MAMVSAALLSYPLSHLVVESKYDKQWNTIIFSFFFFVCVCLCVRKRKPEWKSPTTLSPFVTGRVEGEPKKSKL
jgi:hypothetical protein